MQSGEVVPTIKIKPSDKSQGEFVEINASDFDPAIHKPLSADECAKLIAEAAQPGEAEEVNADTMAAAEPEAPKPAPKKRAPAKKKGK